MPAGTTILMPVSHEESFAPLTLADSYFQVALYAAQAYITLPFLNQTAYLVCSTEVSSNFTANHRTGSIYKVETVQKNRPCPLGLSVDLTEWLPAIPDKKIHVSLKLAAVRDRPFGKLTDAIGELGLVSSLSLLGPHISEGVKVAGIVGKILGTVLEEGKEDNLLALTVDLSVSELASGYWAIIAPDTPNDRPTALRLRAGGVLDDPKTAFSERNTYAVLKVRALERRGPEAARVTAWGGLLEDGLRRVRRLCSSGAERDRRKANALWLDTLDQAEPLAEQDMSFLKSEVRQIFQWYELEKRKLVDPTARTTVESTDRALLDEELDEDLQRLLGVSTERELEQEVDAYQAALARSAANAVEQQG